MFHAAEEVDLIWLASLGQNFLRLVAFRSGEDRVSLCVLDVQSPGKLKEYLVGQLTSCSDGQGTLDRRQLIGLHEARMRHIGNITASGLEQTNGIFGLMRVQSQGACA